MADLTRDESSSSLFLDPEAERLFNNPDLAESPSTVPAVKRACDKCHARKVKCDGTAPCKTCVRRNSECTFLNRILPKGPAPKRGRQGEHNEGSNIGAASTRNHKGTKGGTRGRRRKKANLTRHAPFSDTSSPAAIPGTTPSAKPDTRSSPDAITDGYVTTPQTRIPELFANFPPTFPANLRPPPEFEAITAELVDEEYNREKTTAQGESEALEPNEPGVLDWLTLCSPDPLLSGQFSIEASAAEGPEAVSSSLSMETPFWAEGGAQDESGPQSQSEKLSWWPTARGPTSAPVTTISERLPPLGSSVPSPSLFRFVPDLTPSEANPISFLDSYVQQGSGTLRFHDSVPGLSTPRPPIMPHPSPLFIFALDNTIVPYLKTYYDRIYPMMPILPPTAVFPHLPSEGHSYSLSVDRTSDPKFLAVVLCMVALASIHPLHHHELSVKQRRIDQAIAALDEACRLSASWSHGCHPSVESILTSYLMFGTLLELGYEDGARVRLREAVALGEVMSLGHAVAYAGISKEEQRRRLSMFWVLAVTERAYALQRSGPIVFSSSLCEHPGAMVSLSTCSSLHMRHLAKLFSYIDSDLVDCWTGRCLSSLKSTNLSAMGNVANNRVSTVRCHLTRSKAKSILDSLSRSPEELFKDLDKLADVQRSDLLVTWQWLRNRIWCLAENHGLAHKDKDYSKEFGPSYPVEVAVTTIALCRNFASSSMEAHGAGFVEKLYDITATITEILKSPQNGSINLSIFPKLETLVRELHFYVARHREGKMFAEKLSGELALVSTEILTGTEPVLAY